MRAGSAYRRLVLFIHLRVVVLSPCDVMEKGLGLLIFILRGFLGTDKFNVILPYVVVLCACKR